MDYQEQIIYWLGLDDMRMEALELASSLKLNDWCLAAGFVRNLVWDHLHGYETSTPLSDIDLIYFNKNQCAPEVDQKYKDQLILLSNWPWSVKNQARMHLRNDDPAYLSSCDAMSYWVEVEAAVAATIEDGKVCLVAPFGLDALFANTITINKKRIKKNAFNARIQDKRWLELWPNLKIIND